MLVTVGRQPAVDGLGLGELSLRRQGDFVEIDDRCQTSMRGVYAIGDVTPGLMLAHRAMAQGEIVADVVAAQVEGAQGRAPTRFERSGEVFACLVLANGPVAPSPVPVAHTAKTDA